MTSFSIPRSYLGFLPLCCLVFVSSLFWFYFSLQDPEFISAENEGLLLSIISLIYFMFLISVGIQSINLLYFIFPFVILTVPNAINDLLLNFYFAPIGYGSQTVSFINHIDIFVLIFLFKEQSWRYSTYDLKRIKLRQKVLAFTLITIAFSFIGQLISVSQNNELLKLLFLDTNQLRYLCYFPMLVFSINIEKWEKFRNGILISCFILLLESIVFTKVNNFSVLTSGNFGANTLAVTLSFISLILVFSKGVGKINFACAVFLIIAISFLTDTRSVVFAFFGSVFLTLLFLSFKARAVCFALFIPLTAYVTQILNYDTILNGFDFIKSAMQSYDVAVNQLTVTPSNSSIITRLSMWAASGKILMDYPGGIGLSGWHYLRKDYGFDLGILIDPHNNYIHTFLSFGFVGGLFYQIVLLLYPSLIAIKSKHVGYVLTLFFIALCNVTNSNFQKHQLLMLYIVFLAFFLNKYVRNSHKGGFLNAS